MIIAIYWLQLYIEMAQNAEAVVELLDDMHIENGSECGGSGRAA
jgi:hypothetical protein